MRSKAAAPLALFLLLGCARESGESPPPRSYGSGSYGAPSPGAYVPPQQASSPQAPQQQPATLLGAAVTAFGILVQHIPQIPSQLPPLPQMGNGLPWPFPWPAPQPPSGPGPTPPSAGGGSPGDWVAFEDEVLRRTNERRAMGAVCGGQPMAPAGPLRDHAFLRNAARGHSRDMAVRNYFDHTSPEGAGPANRAAAAGYQSQFVAENIAAGQTDPARVVQAWVESPGHCLNLMDPRYSVLGVGYFFKSGDKFGHYWTQDFGG